MHLLLLPNLISLISATGSSEEQPTLAFPKNANPKTTCDSLPNFSEHSKNYQAETTQITTQNLRNTCEMKTTPTILPLSKAIAPFSPAGTLLPAGRALEETGRAFLSAGRPVGVALLSGGDGSRLGAQLPKGLFKIHGKCLFEWHIDRLRALHAEFQTPIHLFIMTSASTHPPVSRFFSEHANDFSFLQGITVFQQGSLEVTEIGSGQPLMREGTPVKAPQGNGDFFAAIAKTEAWRIPEFIAVVSVDNVLAKALDAVAVGAFMEGNLEVLSKAVVAKDGESVGAFYTDGEGRVLIREYSEPVKGCGSGSGFEKGIRAGEQRRAGDRQGFKEATEKPLGNICNHIFSREFIERMKDKPLPFHEARKKVPFTNLAGSLVTPEKVNGIKKEKFIFDSFEYAQRNGVLVVPRECEFSPLKNAEGSDSPETCDAALERLLRTEKDL